jgi:tRNA threonylcarbamoyladenosine biosynthesis protein TsaE
VGAVTSRPAPDLEREVQSSSPDETSALGARLGAVLQPGDFVGLIGELGAGKTHFVRGVAEGAGVLKEEVASPTFAIVYPYRGRVPLYHADLYRVADYDELYATGFMDLGSDGAVLVEWLDKVPNAAPPEVLLLSFEVSADEQRRIVARAWGARPARLLADWLGS